jgi:hypothetical protein
LSAIKLARLIDAGGQAALAKLLRQKTIKSDNKREGMGQLLKSNLRLFGRRHCWRFQFSLQCGLIGNPRFHDLHLPAQHLFNIQVPVSELLLQRRELLRQ